MSRIVMHHDNIAAMFADPAGPVAEIVRDRGERVRDMARLMAPVDTGALRDSIRADLEHDGVSYVSHVGSDLEYAIWVEMGTGLFGTHRRRIRPKRAKALRWESGGQVIYAASTRGMRAQPYLRPALSAVMR